MAPRWRWRVGKLARRSWSRVCRKLYRDPERGTGRCILVAGTARSGTTWLADLIASQASCRMMFEPFHREKVAAIGSLQYFQYLRPDDDHEVLERYCRQLFSGAIRHPWIDREVRRLAPRYRLIKEIRANLFLRWIRERFPDVRMMLVFRHPCAVVASRLSLGWATDTDLDPFLAQEALCEEVPFDVLRRIRDHGSEAEKHAAIWCVSYLVPLRQFATARIPCVFYENLVAAPERELPIVFAAAGLPHDESVFDRLRVPSTTTVSHSAVTRGDPGLGDWAGRLSKLQIEEILGVLERFGMSHVYGRSEMPRTGDPWAGSGASHTPGGTGA